MAPQERLSSQRDVASITPPVHEPPDSMPPRTSSPSSRSPSARSSERGSRQYLQAQRLRATVGVNKVWACDRCYKLKVKCDSGKPACASCIKHGLGNACAYGGAARASSSKRPDLPEYSRAFDQRVKEPPTSDDNSDTYNPRPKKRALKPRSKSFTSEPPSSATSSASSIEQRIPEPVNDAYGNVRHESGHHPGPTTDRDIRVQLLPTSAASTRPLAPHDLFSPEVQRDLVNTFFRKIATFLLGCPIHEPTFAPHLYFERPEHSEFLVTSLCALSAPYSDHPVVVSYWQSNDLPRYLAGEPFFFKGQAMVPHMIDSPSLEVVAGLLYLSSAAAAMGKSSSQGAPLKFPLMQMAVNLALQLRLNIDPDVEEVHGQLTWIQREVRRRFWWTLFCMETINSTPSHEPPPSIDKFNQPLPCRGPYLHGSSPTVRSPAPDALFYSVLTSDSLPRLSAFTPGIDLDVMDCMSRLTRIFHAIKQLSGTVWEMAQKLARRVSSEDVERIHALKDASYHARIQQLETELEEWLELLPEWARNIDQYPVIPELSSSARPPLWQLFSLHLFHHACYVALHLPTLIAFPITSPLPPDALSIQSTIDAAYRICYHHTQHVAFLLERLRRVTYTSDHIHPWESFYLLYTGLVLIRQSTKPSDIRHQSTIQHNVDNHIWLMEQVGQRWYSTKRIQELLSEVIVAQEYSCLTVDI